jgi:hypothetical protein
MDFGGGALHIQEFFFSGSLLSTDAYYLQQKAFPKEMVDMKAFLEMLAYSLACSMLHAGNAQVLQ